MALIKCPECGIEVSGMAQACPNCLYPIQKMKRRKQVKLLVKSSRKTLGNKFEAYLSSIINILKSTYTYEPIKLSIILPVICIVIIIGVSVFSGINYKFYINDYGTGKSILTSDVYKSVFLLKLPIIQLIILVVTAIMVNRKNKFSKYFIWFGMLIAWISVFDFIQANLTQLFFSRVDYHYIYDTTLGGKVTIAIIYNCIKAAIEQELWIEYVEELLVSSISYAVYLFSVYFIYRKRFLNPCKKSLCCPKCNIVYALDSKGIKYCHKCGTEVVEIMENSQRLISKSATTTLTIAIFIIMIICPFVKNELCSYMIINMNEDTSLEHVLNAFGYLQETEYSVYVGGTGYLRYPNLKFNGIEGDLIVEFFDNKLRRWSFEIEECLDKRDIRDIREFLEKNIGREREEEPIYAWFPEFSYSYDSDIFFYKPNTYEIVYYSY